MATTITQKPKYKRLVPVGQEIIFVVSNNTLVQTKTNVKFVAKVHISDGSIVNLSNTSTQIGTFKTVPNNKGVGIFNFRDVIESYVSSDNTSAEDSSVKGVKDITGGTYPLHIIDRFSFNNNLSKFFAVQFVVQYLDDVVGSATFGQIVEEDFANSTSYNIFNGYVPFDAIYKQDGANFGFDMETTPSYVIGSNSSALFLTNMPDVQYCNAEDYMTIALFRNSFFTQYKISTYNFSNVLIGTASSLFQNTLNNGGSAFNNNTKRNFQYIGIGVANIRQRFAAFNTEITAGNVKYYEFTCLDSSGAAVSKTLTINVNCPTLKGYEPVRLCWLNQWGAWDYYTFTLKSTKTFNTKGSTYNQLGGSWNDSSYKLNSFKGGKKSFRVNATEKITINTDYITEEEGKVFEFMINSPEVMLLSGYIEETASEFAEKANNQYVQPVRLMTNNITRKTIANDKLIQFTFEVEKTKTLRTQSV